MITSKVSNIVSQAHSICSMLPVLKGLNSLLSPCLVPGKESQFYCAKYYSPQIYQARPILTSAGLWPSSQPPPHWWSPRFALQRSSPSLWTFSILTHRCPENKATSSRQRYLTGEDFKGSILVLFAPWVEQKFIYTNFFEQILNLHFQSTDMCWRTCGSVGL